MALSQSENYQLEGDLDNGGNYSTSENYQGIDSINGENPPSVSLEGNNPTVIEIIDDDVVSQGIISKITSSISDVIQGIAEGSVVEAVTSNNVVSETKTPLAATVAALTGMIAAIPLAANIPLTYSFSNLLFSIFPFLGRRKKNQYWGKVYDAESSQPITQAIVRINSIETKKVLQTQITDNDGRFNLMIAPGQYYLEVFKENYLFPSKMVSSDYHGEVINIKDNKILELSVPLDPKLDQVISHVKKVWHIRKLLEILYYPLLIIGSFLAIIFYLKYKDMGNLLVLLLYFVILFYEIYKSFGSKPYGLVFDVANKNPLDISIVRIFDQKQGKLVTTKVTDIKGKFIFLVNSGQYYLTAIKQGYNQFKSDTLEFKHSSAINIDVPLSKD